MKTFFISVASVGLLYVLTFALAYGYDEGTMNNKIIGKASTLLYEVLKFPFVYILPIRFYLLGIGMNISLYAALITLLRNVLNKTRR